MKKILLMVPRFNMGGAETYTAMIAQQLQERGYKVYIASGGGMLADKLAKKGIKNFWLPMRLSTDISAFLLKYIIKKYKIDLIHANSAAAGITAMKYKQRYNQNMPVVLTAHGNFSTPKKENILKGCDKIIYVSNFVKDDAISKGFKNENACVIYTGIDEKKFNNKLSTNTGREQYNITKDDFVISITARMKNLRNKGHQDLLEMMNKYPEARKWHLLVIGKGKGLFKLKKMIHQFKLKHNIHCIGQVDDVQNYIALANVVVLPSDFETFGLALAEGMLMGKPGVAYNVGGIPEIIKNGENGFLVKYKDIDDLYNKLSILANDRNLCEKMGKNAHKYVSEHYTCKKMMDKIEIIYNNLL